METAPSERDHMTPDDSSGVRRKEGFLRTKLCKFHAQGLCVFGDTCTYAHNSADLAPRPDFSKTRLCRRFAMDGMCVEGERCRFAHGEAELRMEPQKRWPSNTDAEVEMRDTAKPNREAPRDSRSPGGRAAQGKKQKQALPSRAGPESGRSGGILDPATGIAGLLLQQLEVEQQQLERLQQIQQTKQLLIDIHLRQLCAHMAISDYATSLLSPSSSQERQGQPPQPGDQSEASLFWALSRIQSSFVGTVMRQPASAADAGGGLLSTLHPSVAPWSSTPRDVAARAAQGGNYNDCAEWGGHAPPSTPWLPAFGDRNPDSYAEGKWDNSAFEELFAGQLAWSRQTTPAADFEDSVCGMDPDWVADVEGRSMSPSPWQQPEQQLLEARFGEKREDGSA